MPKAIELLPCPFCGAEAELYGECDMVWARCSNEDCRAQRIYKFDESEDAAEDWNCRGQQDEDVTPVYGTGTATRRIDDLGRVAIPKFIRQALNISEGDVLEFILYSSAGGVFIKPEKEGV